MRVKHNQPVCNLQKMLIKVLCKAHLFLPYSMVVMKLVALTLPLPESLIETFKVLLVFESVDEILKCDHSNESYRVVLSHGTIYY